MSRSPRVTVFIPVNNREHYITTAIDSILQQDFTDFELLIVDDGSTDRTVEVVSGYEDSRIRLECNGRNLGIPATRNRGLALAQGEYIALLDSDDYAYPWRLRRQVEYLDRHPHVVQVGGWCTLMDAEGKPLRRIRRQPTRPEDVDVHLVYHCALINRTIMGRTAGLREFGYDEKFSRCQDYELHGRLAERHAMANMPEILVCGREHPGRVTRGTRDLGCNRKMAIQGRLLEGLGVKFSEDDLVLHYGLTQKPSSERPRSAAHLEWVEDWLHRLLSANRSSRRYDPAAMSRTLGLVWATSCWFDRTSGSRAGWAVKLASSPLALGIPGTLVSRWMWDSMVPVNRKRLRAAIAA